ncbi:MAG: class I SAM-dependent methyltransferase [Flammeovirgaceae bacterium]|nr:class I SAM-dependent methyltransferase [Flammeovirgaceae bacterium]
MKTFVRHWLNEVDDHSLHSPFFFDFYKNVVRNTAGLGAFKPFEDLRLKLIENTTPITIEDLGSTPVNGTQPTIGTVASTSLSPQKFAALYNRILHYQSATKVLELGTSMGLTALYLSQYPGSQIYTFEGNKTLANIALTHFEYFEKKNIHLIEGKIDSTLPEFLQRPGNFSFVLMDANHRYEPTIRYFKWLVKRLDEKSIVVIDDIYRSPEMEKAWNELRRHDLVYGSIDLYRCGILFFDTRINKQHFTLSF